MDAQSSWSGPYGNEPQEKMSSSGTFKALGVALEELSSALERIEQRAGAVLQQKDADVDQPVAMVASSHLGELVQRLEVLVGRAHGIATRVDL